MTLCMWIRGSHGQVMYKESVILSISVIASYMMNWVNFLFILRNLMCDELASCGLKGLDSGVGEFWPWATFQDVLVHQDLSLSQEKDLT